MALLCQCSSLFTEMDLDLGKTAIVTLKVRLTDTALFKEHYRLIQTSMYKEVKAHP